MRSLCLNSCSFFFLITLLFVPIETRAGESAPEDELKVAYIYNFLKFTQWPELAFDSPDSEIRLCTIGRDALSGRLPELAAKRVRQRPINVINIKEHKALEISAEAIRSRQCHLLFIEGSAEQLSVLPGELKGMPLLLVSDAKDFATHGGMIGLKIIDKRVRFEVNLETLANHKITLSSLLLKLASSVYGV